MKSLFKFFIILLLLVVFIAAATIRLADNTIWQLIILLSVLSINLFRFGFSKLLNEIKVILPFIITMFIVYLILGLIGFKAYSSINSGQNSLLFWLNFGLEKSFLFINTIFFFQFILSYISINDILALPLKIGFKKYLILGRALFLFAISNISNIEFHLKLMPEYQKKKLSLKQWFGLKLEHTLAIITMILRESKLKGELIDNRIQHCFIHNND